MGKIKERGVTSLPLVKDGLDDIRCYLDNLTEAQQIQLIMETLVSEEAPAVGLGVHLDYLDFEAYLDDKLDEVDAEIVEGHIKMCTSCYSQVISMKLAVMATLTPGRANSFLEQRARLMIPEYPEVLQHFTGKITSIDTETVSLQLWDTETQEPYAVTYEKSVLDEYPMNVGDRVNCTLQQRNGKSEMVFTPDRNSCLSSEERLRMQSEAEVKYADFPGEGIY